MMRFRITSSGLEVLLVSLFFVFIASLLSILSVIKYATFSSEWAFDLAFFNNLFYNSIHGDLFYQSVNLAEREGLFKLSHFYPIILLFLPLYRLFPAITTLLIVQSVILATGTIPLYLMIKRWFTSKVSSFLLMITLFIHPPFFLVHLADFRPILLFIPLFLWLFYFVESDRPITFLVVLLLTLLTREEVPFLLIPLPFYLLLKKSRSGRTKWFLISLIPILIYISFLYFMRGSVSDYINYEKCLKRISGLEIWKDALTDPISSNKVRFIFEKFLMPTIYPSLLAPDILLIILPVHLYLFLFSQYSWAVFKGPYLHHLAPLVPLFMIACTVGVSRVMKLLEKASPLTLDRKVAGVVIALLLFITEGVFLLININDTRQRYMPYTYNDCIFKAHGLWRLINEIPEDAVVATDYTLIAGVSTRKRAHCYKYGLFMDRDGSSGVLLGGTERRVYIDEIDYILIFNDDLETLPIEDRGFVHAGSSGGYHLYKRGVL